MFFKIENTKENKVVAEKASLANNFFSRLKGLLGTKELPKGEALILDPCKSVHMVGMRYALDIVFLDENNVVVALNKNLKPFQFSSYYGKAKKAVELPIGSIDEARVSVGEKLEFKAL